MPTDENLSVYEAIERRRDVRNEFTGGPIPDETFLRILGAAHAAPSVGLTQPWDFIRVDAVNTRQAFHDHVMGERLLFAESLPPDQAKVFAEIKIEGILDATTGLVVTYDSSRGAPHVLGRHAIADAGLYSTCLAIENLWLAATAEGLGVGWVSFYREAFLQQLLGIPTTVRPVAWLCLGPVTELQTVPDLERHGWRSRRPLQDAIRLERW